MLAILGSTHQLFLELVPNCTKCVPLYQRGPQDLSQFALTAPLCVLESMSWCCGTLLQAGKWLGRHQSDHSYQKRLSLGPRGGLIARHCSCALSRCIVTCFVHLSKLSSLNLIIQIAQLYKHLPKETV